MQHIKISGGAGAPMRISSTGWIYEKDEPKPDDAIPTRHNRAIRRVMDQHMRRKFGRVRSRLICTRCFKPYVAPISISCCCPVAKPTRRSK